MESFEDVLNNFGPEGSLQRRFVKIALPVTVILLAYTVLSLSIQKYTILIEMLSVYFIPLAGTPAAVTHGLNSGVHPAIIVSWLTIVEFSGAFLVWLNFDFLEKIPWAGKILLKWEKKGKHYVGKHEWALDFRILGVIAFILIPIEGFGAYAAPVLGKILNMKMWQVLIAVLVAGAIRFGGWASGISAVV
jgi:uncharacterized membrane protein